jgi:hypothetical protein
MTEIPDELRELHHRLRSVHFRPRASLEPEVLKRLQNRDTPRGSPSRWSRRHLAMAAAAFLTAATAISYWLVSSRAVVTVDRCCYDLDGGGKADDGVLVLAERDDRVHRLRVYEDLDGSATFTPADVVRLDRGEKPAIHGAGVAGIVTTRRCCVDLDGGGPQDDGLLIMAAPPDQVLMAAIYETGSTVAGSRHQDGWLLR